MRLPKALVRAITRYVEGLRFNTNFILILKRRIKWYHIRPLLRPRKESIFSVQFFIYSDVGFSGRPPRPPRTLLRSRNPPSVILLSNLFQSQFNPAKNRWAINLAEKSCVETRQI